MIEVQVEKERTVSKHHLKKFTLRAKRINKRYNLMLTTRQRPITERHLIVVPWEGGLLQTHQYVTKTRLIEEKVLTDVYRVLRTNENPDNGITAKDPHSTVGAAYHVAWGSHSFKKRKSKYISTCQYLKDAQRLAGIHFTNYGVNCEIIGIELHNWKTEEDAYNIREIFPVWDLNVRNTVIFHEKPDSDTESNFHKFAPIFNEVLLVGHVPKKYIYVPCFF